MSVSTLFLEEAASAISPFFFVIIVIYFIYLFILFYFILFYFFGAPRKLSGRMEAGIQPFSQPQKPSTFSQHQSETALATIPLLIS